MLSSPAKGMSKQPAIAATSPTPIDRSAPSGYACCLAIRRIVRSRFRLKWLHGLLQFLGNPEGDLLARLDLDRLAGRRVPSHPGRTLPHLEDAEAGQADFVALLEVPGCQRHQIAQHGLGLLLRQVMAVRQGGGEMLERDGGLRPWLGRRISWLRGQLSSLVA